MKKLFTFLIAVLLSVSVFAQAPQKMSYQAVIRKSNNQLITSQDVGMKISILQGSISGSPVYVETQTPTTNNNGLVSIEIGSGDIVSGTFAIIDWAAGPYFIKTEIDTNGGNNYTIIGTSQLLSVPYALYAQKTAFNYYLDIDNTVTLYPGDTLSTNLKVNWIDGDPQDISFSLSGLPNNISYSITTNPMTPPMTGSNTPKIILSSNLTVSAGTYPITITAISSGGLQKTVSFNLIVKSYNIAGNYTCSTIFSNCTNPADNHTYTYISTVTMPSETSIIISYYNGYGSSAWITADYFGNTLNILNQSISGVTGKTTIGTGVTNHNAIVSVSATDTYTGGNTCHVNTTYTKQ